MIILIPRIVSHVDRLTENDTSAKLDPLLYKFETLENSQTQLDYPVSEKARSTAAYTSHMSSTEAAANTNCSSAYTPRKTIYSLPPRYTPNYTVCSDHYLQIKAGLVRVTNVTYDVHILCGIA